MKFDPKLEQYRIRDGYWATKTGETFGSFLIPHWSNILTVVAHDGIVELPEHERFAGWEHVSVSLKNRCPSWPEMSFVKSLFWAQEDTVMQLHVPTAEHILISTSIVCTSGVQSE